MVITKSNNSKNDIASITDANIAYANNDTKYLLYTNNNSLYLLDTTIGGVGEHISSSILSYGFSTDDRKVYYITKDNSLYLYNRANKETNFIANNVDKVEIVKDDYLLYSQNKSLIFQKLNEQPILVADKYLTAELNTDNHMILYSQANQELKDYLTYDLNNSSYTKVLEGITKLYANDSNYTKFLYTKPTTNSLDISHLLKDDYLESDKNYVSYKYEDYTSGKITKSQYEANQELGKNIEFRNRLREYIKDYGKFGSDLYYQNNDTKTLIASNINKVYYHNIRNQYYSFTTYNFENNALNIDNYTKNEDVEKFYDDIENAKLNSLYFKQGTEDSSLAYKNITTDAKVIIRNNQEYYLILKDQDYYNLYYSKINNHTVKQVVQIDTGLPSYKLNIDYQRGYLYTIYKEGRFYLQLVNEGNVTTLVQDINNEYYTVSEGKDSIYYLKTINEYTNDLYIYNGIRHFKIASDIYSFLYINNDLIYVTKNYDSITKTSDLYRLNNNHLVLIYTDIADWYSPLKDTEEEPNTTEFNIEEDS